MIAGTERSGSTLLDMMLGHSQYGFSVGELRALFWPFRPYQMLGEKGCFCSDEECTFWSDIKCGGAGSAYHSIFRRMPEIDFIVDSSKFPLWIQDQRRYVENQGYLFLPVIIYKTPLEFAYSKLKRGQLAGAIERWMHTHQELFRVVDDFTAVRYEGLARAPGSKLQSLCRVLGIRYVRGMEDFWESDAKHLLFGSGTVTHSDHLVYYDAQYDADKVSFLQSTLDLEREDLRDVMAVLQAYEVDAEQEVPGSIERLKYDIAEYRPSARLRHRASSTPYYWLNRRLPKLLYWVHRAVSKIERVAKGVVARSTN
jgi:hypothetical protein